MRRLLLRLLDRAPNAGEDVMRHAERWKRLAEVLHPGEYADKYPRALAAITAARRNDPPASFGSRVETMLAQRQIAALTPLLQERPGEFARRLDVTLRRATEADAVLDAFETVAIQVSTPILLQVLAQVRAPRPLPLRAFTPKGALAKIYGIKDRREPLTPEVLARAAQICQDALIKRLHRCDIVDAPHGASEFIDLDHDALVEKGIRYVVTSINSFTEQPYCDP